jgi:hypothetical protein
MRRSAIFLISAVASTAQSLPTAPGAHVVSVSAPAERGNEPGIAVNPRNPDQVVAVYQGRARAAYSADGGRTFALAEGTAPSDWRSAGDVSTAFDTHGNAFLCYLVFDRLGTTSYWAHGAGRNGIFVRRSPDGGKTWEHDAVPLKAFPTGNEPDLQWEDMPRIFSDTAPKSPYAGNIYVGWIEWQIDKSVILFSRSADAGRTWSPPMRISTHAGLPRDDNGGLVGFVGSVGADGTIYAVWNDASSIAFTTSHDGGKTFAPSRSVVATGPPYFGGVPGVSRVMGFPQIGVDWSAAGTLYLAWSDYIHGDIDVFLSSSADHGHTWSRPVRVNDDPLHNGRDQFFQWMAVDPVTGVVYVQFYDRRDDPANRKTRVTLARSTDHGRTFTNYAWTATPFEGEQIFLGDYTWLAAYNDSVFGVWTEAADPEGIVPDARGRAPTVVRVGTADFSGVK